MGFYEVIFHINLAQVFSPYFELWIILCYVLRLKEMSVNLTKNVHLDTGHLTGAEL